MASGWGLNGGTSRCFPFWQEVLSCYIINTNSEDTSGQKKCVPVLDDYYECLHHKKELAKTRAMQREYAKKLMSEGDVERPSAQEVRTLGLIPDRKPEDVHLKPARFLPHKGPSIT